MRTLRLLLAMPLALSSGLGVVAAQPAGVVTQGSPDTMIGGKPAARVGDGTAGGAPVVEGSRDVFINGRPAAIAGGRSGCGDVVIGGAANVFINGRPAAQTGSPTRALTPTWAFTPCDTAPAPGSVTGSQVSGARSLMSESTSDARS